MQFVVLTNVLERKKVYMVVIQVCHRIISKMMNEFDGLVAVMVSKALSILLWVL